MTDWVLHVAIWMTLNGHRVWIEAAPEGKSVFSVKEDCVREGKKYLPKHDHWSPRVWCAPQRNVRAPLTIVMPDAVEVTRDK